MAAAASESFAQPQPAARAEKRQRREIKRAHRIKKLLRKYDLNHDGVVDPSEMPPRLAQKMQKLDRNGDGWLDANDVAAPRPRRR